MADQMTPMVAIAQKLASDKSSAIQMLKRIINSAARPVKAASTDVMLQAVPAALLEEAKALLQQIDVVR